MMFILVMGQVCYQLVIPADHDLGVKVARPYAHVFGTDDDIKFSTLDLSSDLPVSDEVVSVTLSCPDASMRNELMKRGFGSDKNVDS